MNYYWLLLLGLFPLSLLAWFRYLQAKRVYQILVLRHPLSSLAVYWRTMTYEQFQAHNPTLPSELYYMTTVHRPGQAKVIEPLSGATWARFQVAFDTTAIMLMSPN